MSAIQLVRWHDELGDHLGLSRDYRHGVAALDDIPTEGRIVSVDQLQKWCRAQALELSTWAKAQLDQMPLRQVDPTSLLSPVEISELWASGVTYELSRDARMEESTVPDDLYSRLYTADRPELFFKAPGNRIAGPGDWVGIRRDAIWHVPEPELTVILDDTGQLFGFTVGNDMTARDLEADNPLYLPQAKMFHHSASLGPVLVLADTVDPYRLVFRLEIFRHGEKLVDLSTNTGRLRRRLENLVDYLGKEWPLAPWTGLMTGTGIVPPESFFLEDGDVIEISVPEIGILSNPVRRIGADWVNVPEVSRGILRVDPLDNVAVSLGELRPGDVVSVAGRSLTVRDLIPFGHKMALWALRKGDTVIKYGQPIGVANQDIEPGCHVHVHNVESNRGRGDLAMKKEGSS